MPVLFKVLGFVYLASPRARWHTPMTNYLCIFADDKRTASKLSTGGKGFRYVSVYRIRGLVHTDLLPLPLPLSLTLSPSLSLSFSLSFFSPLLQSLLAHVFFSFFFFLLFAFLISFSSVVDSTRVLSYSSVETMVCLEANQIESELNLPTILRYPSSPFSLSQLVTLRLRERYFERRIWDETLIEIRVSI